MYNYTKDDISKAIELLVNLRANLVRNSDEYCIITRVQLYLGHRLLTIISNKPAKTIFFPNGIP